MNTLDNDRLKHNSLVIEIFPSVIVVSLYLLI